MNSTQTTSTQPRTLSSACRRRKELQVDGVRPETLAWAVAEASESAIALAGVPGPEMVRTCLEQACDPRKSGTESEALLVLAAAGVGQVRRELRSLGVDVPLNRNEVFGEIRRASRRSSPSQKMVFAAIREAGAARIMTLLVDRETAFTEALADEIAQASRNDETERVKALVQVGAFGARALHRGVKLDVTKEVIAVGVTASAEMVLSRSPRQTLRHKAQAAEGKTADALAALSFIQTTSLKRAAHTATIRARKLALLEMRRTRRAGEIDGDAIYRAAGVAGASWLMGLMGDCGRSFEQTLAGAIVEAFGVGAPKRARALIEIGAFGVWGLRRGVKADVSEAVRELGPEEIAEILDGGQPHDVLRERAHGAEGRRGELLASLFLVEPRSLKLSTAKALGQLAAPRPRVAEREPGRTPRGEAAERCPAYA